jgi:hypothetical protein
MKKLILAAAVLAAGSFSATAQQSQDVNLSANVAGFCTLGAPTAPTLNFGNATNGVLTGTMTSDLAAYCNSLAKVTLSSGKGAMTYFTSEALADASAPTTGFSNKIEYTATATGTGLPNTTLNTASGATTNATGTAVGVSATMTVSVALNSSLDVLVANPTGTPYSDVLTVTLDPAL